MRKEMGRTGNRRLQSPAASHRQTVTPHEGSIRARRSEEARKARRRPNSGADLPKAGTKGPSSGKIARLYTIGHGNEIIPYHPNP